MVLYIGEISDHAMTHGIFHTYMLKCALQFKLVVSADASMGKYRVLSGMETLSLISGISQGNKRRFWQIIKYLKDF